MIVGRGIPCRVVFAARCAVETVETVAVTVETVAVQTVETKLNVRLDWMGWIGYPIPP